jgi:diaminopimelate epimerase
MGLGTDNVFRIGGWSASADAFRMDGSGNLTMLANVTAYSDERVKTNWRDLHPDFVEHLAEVKHGIYDRTDQTATQVGVSAQSLQKIMEHAVMENADGQLSVAYGNAALVSAVELAKRVVDQETRIQQLESLINTILNKD